MSPRSGTERSERKRGCRRRKEHCRLRLGKIGAEKAVRVVAVPANRRQHRRAASLHRRADSRGLARGSKVRIGIAPGETEPVAQPIEERRRELVGGGRAKADRIGHARVDGRAVVRERWRQVQHVAGAEHLVVRRLEVSEDLERNAHAAARDPTGGRSASAAVPSPCSRKTSYESKCGPTPPPGAARLTMTSSSRAYGRNENRRSSASAAAQCRLTPCTSSDHLRAGSASKSARRNGPWSSDQRERSRTTSRDSTSSRMASAASCREVRSPRNPGIAERARNASFCQKRRRKVDVWRGPNTAHVRSFNGAGIRRL